MKTSLACASDSAPRVEVKLSFGCGASMFILLFFLPSLVSDFSEVLVLSELSITLLLLQNLVNCDV